MYNYNIIHVYIYIYNVQVINYNYYNNQWFPAFLLPSYKSDVHQLVIKGRVFKRDYTLFIIHLILLHCSFDQDFLSCKHRGAL